MSSNVDAWFVRLPDGRVLRANSTAVVRQQLGTGRIPTGSTVRRSPEEEWTSIEWIQEFADVAAEQHKHAEVGAVGRSSGRPPSSPMLELATESGVRPAAATPQLHPPGSSEGSGVAARLDPLRLQTVGVRGLVDELIGALDSTLVRKKIVVVLIATLLLGLLFAFAPWEPLKFAEAKASRDRALVALAVLLVGSAATALITRMTFVEVSRLRPARWSEAFQGLIGLYFRLVFTEIVVAGNTVLILELLRLLPGYFLSDPFKGAIPPALTATLATIVAMIAEVLQWPVFGLSFLLAPILTVEGCPVGTALLQWLRLVRRQFGRAFIYEALVFGIGLIVTLPLFLPLVTFRTIYHNPEIEAAVAATQTVLMVMALGPLYAYLVVANVFIYLNLRYEAGTPRR